MESKKESNSANSSKSKSSNSSGKRFEYSEILINFYDNYKDDLEDILDILYNELGKPPLFQDLDSTESIKTKLIENPITIDKYSLKCEYSFDRILLKSYAFENCYLVIKYLGKVKAKIENYAKSMWVCNSEIAMLLLENKSIYYSKNEISIEDEKNDIDNISLISNLTSLEKAIKENKIIYSTKKDIMDINSILIKIDEKNNNTHFDMSFILTGINSVNFQEIKDPFKVETLSTKIPLDDSIFSVGKLGYFLYNKNIGMTTQIISTFHSSKINGSTNYLYLNINYIKNLRSTSMKKQYFAYYLSNLFNDSKSFKKFYQKISPLIIKQNKEYYNLIFEIIIEFQKYIEPKKKYYFLLDNIYSRDTFIELENKFKDSKNILNKNSRFYFFVQLNNKTVDFIDNNHFYFINNDSSIRPKSYIDSLFDENYEKNYLTRIKKIFDDKMSNYKEIDRFTMILKAKYLSLTKEDKTKNEIKELFKIFDEFFQISCINKSNKIIINNIEFIDITVRDFFNDQFNSILCEYINKNELNIFENIINSSIEGILLEKQIILQLIASSFIDIIKIERIYCCCDIKEKKKINANNCIIIQKQENSPLYDFGIIILLNNIPTLKVYQVGLNKKLIELEKLDVDKINLDIEYFIKKIYINFGIKILQYSFGIITSKAGYDSNQNEKKAEDKKDINNINEAKEAYEKGYKNYEIMRQFCERNSYEFLIFDKNDKTFFINYNNNLEKIKFLEYFYKNSLIKIKNIFEDFSENLIKMYYNKNDFSYISEKIKSSFKETKDNLEIKLIGKFKCLDNCINKIKNNNLFLCWNDISNDIFCVLNQDKIFSEKEIKINELSFNAEYFFICTIKGINESEIKNTKNVDISLIQSNKKSKENINSIQSKFVGKKRIRDEKKKPIY